MKIKESVQLLRRPDNIEYDPVTDAYYIGGRVDTMEFVKLAVEATKDNISRVQVFKNHEPIASGGV